MYSKTTFLKTMFLLFGLFVGTLVSAQISNNTISSSQEICKGATPNLFTGAIPTGGNGTFNYQWQMSTVSSTSDFNNISAANDTIYQSGALTTTTWFRRVFDDGVIGDTSNVIEITVNPYPTVSFSVNTAGQCLVNNNFSFTNSSTIATGSLTYAWDFGDGNTASTTDASNTYSAIGKYSVKLVAYSDKGCNDSTSSSISVYSNPVAIINTPSMTSTCDNGTVIHLTGDTLSASYKTNKLTITYDASQGQSGLSGASKVYIHSGTTTTNVQGAVWSNVVGNWGSDDGIGEMTSLGNDKWEISIDALKYFSLNPNDNIKYIAMVFRNADGSQTGKDVNGDDIFIDVQSGTISSTFTGVSASYTQTYQWYKNGSSISGATTPYYTASTTGNYQLEVDGSLGCATKSSALALSFNPYPTLKANVNNNAQCANGNSFEFYDSSSISSGSYTRLWSFGDGNTDTAAVSNYSYNTTGGYYVKLTLTSDKGCSTEDSTMVNIYPSPVADGAINSFYQCFNGNNYVLSDSSSISSGSYTLLWNFGDGYTDNSSVASHSYSAAGSYDINLVVTSDMGCKDSIGATVTVDESPVAKFSVSNNEQCFNGHSFDFSDSSTIANGTYTRLWNFGDGNSDTSANPIYSYNAEGTYDVKIYVESNFGCIDSAVQTVTINPSPVANLVTGSTTQCFNGNSFSAYDTSSISSGTYTVLWNFGDGFSDTTLAVTHSYAAAGTYTGSLVVTSDKGCIDSLTGTITINESPVVKIITNSNVQCFNGNSFDFNDSSMIANGTLVSRLWSLGDGTTDTNFTVNHSYTTEGIYYAKLTSTSDLGCSSEDSTMITVNASPKANVGINADTQCFNGNNFVVSDSSSISSGSYTIMWDFGDGYTDTNAVASHAYAASGVYTGSLKITSDQGCTDSISGSLTVNVSPVAKFSITNAIQCLNGNSVDFVDSSSIASGTINGMWNYGDGSSDTTTVTSHQYNAAGTYTAWIVVTSDLGCQDSTSSSVTINANPDASFSINNASQCLNGNSFDYTNTSNGGLSYAWNYGDNATDTATNGSHSYTTDGSYTVELITVDANGCTDTASNAIEVNPMPNAKWGVNNATQCLNSNSFNFSDSSSVSAGSYTRSWSFGNSVSDSATNPTVVYAAAGQYQVILTITSDKGCVGTASNLVTVNSNPVAVITPSGPTSFCIGNNVVLQSSVGTGYTYQWKKDGSNISGASDSSYKAIATGGFTVMITNAAGCTDLSKEVKVTVSAKSNFGKIAGVTAVNNNSVQTYSVPFTAGVNYQWSVIGGNIISAQGNNSVQVQWSSVGNGKVYLTADCYNLDSLGVNVLSGVGSVNAAKAEMYPNPSTGILNIKLPETGVYTLMNIYDISGKLVSTENLKGEVQFTKDLSFLSNGVYQVVIVGQESTINQKIVITK